MVGNNGKRAAGDLLLVQGRVLTPNDSPVANALVEIWQTNAWGRYQDHRDRSDVPWDPNFQGYGHVTTDANGAYAFRTIRPAGYGQGYFRRTPHIHFRISGRHFDRLTTQMYFTGEPENANDGPLNRISDSATRERLIVDLQPVQEQEMRMWRGLLNIVLGKNLP
jgi:protocatechuate 3,4-dioxygenase beta subunit